MGSFSDELKDLAVKLAELAADDRVAEDLKRRIAAKVRKAVCQCLEAGRLSAIASDLESRAETWQALRPEIDQQLRQLLSLSPQDAPLPR
jgi:hypothetical protein